jgi:hypothetical protein
MRSLIVLLPLCILTLSISAQVKIEKWHFFEIVLFAQHNGNAFTEEITQ